MSVIHLVEHFSHTGPSRMKDALLLALSELVRKEVSADQLLRRIVDVMAKELRAERATIFWLDAARQELISIAGHLPELEEIRVPISQGVAGEVARTAKIINVAEDLGSPRIWRQVDQETGYQTRTMLAGPLFGQDGDVIGVVQFLNKEDGTFDEDDEATLLHLSRQAALLLGETTLSRRPKEDSDLELGARFNRIIGQGPAMRSVFKAVRKVASTDATVMLRGESGTGKTLVARALHHNSRRASGPFVAVDCTTLPEGLMENELFGHERGAYTGADKRAIGKVEAAESGTLFLDEIGDLPLAMQGKLLTLLQERSYSRVGGTQRIDADIRVVAATNRKLEELISEGKFRQDLYYRLKVVELEIPALREREPADIQALAEFFVAESSRRHARPVEGFTEGAMKKLMAHPWPGNVRELEHSIESAVIFAEGLKIGAEELALPGAVLGPNPHPFADEPTLAQLEERYINWLLERHDGNRSECARILNVGRNTLIRKISGNPFDR